MRAGFFEESFQLATGRAPTTEETIELLNIEARVEGSDLSTSRDSNTPEHDDGETDPTPAMLTYYRDEILERLREVGM